MHFVIAGSMDCSQFTYAVMVAQRLHENLPDFTYLKIAFKPDQFQNWLIRICKENNWYHISSPIIWREYGLKMGKKDFIGDINKFLDLCYDYYGIPQEILSAEQFKKGEIDWFTKRTESEYFECVKLETKKRREFRSRQICITGASSCITEIIIMELLSNKIQRRENGLEIRLFDDPERTKKLGAMALDGKCCPGPSGFGNCRVAATLREALFDVDMVIVLDSFTRRSNETLVRWLKRNRNAMCALGKALNKYAPQHCRVILGGPSTQPLCYNATVLASFATRLHVRNIVAVTQDLGRQILRPLSVRTKIPLKDFFCPPVWGFVGLNKFIDIRKTLHTYLKKVPGKRVKSTIPQGKEEYHLRTCESLLDEKESGELQRQVSGQRAEIFPQLERWPYLAKATAILDLLKLWGIKREDGNGEILSLGVYSDGTFNIPQGIYWSQPVVLVDGFWMPYAEFPIPRSPHFSAYYLFMFSVASLYRTKVKPRIYIPPRKKKKPKEKQKFDFDKIAEAVGMPVIRTDPDCVSYLKYLSRTELGIDLDKIKDTIEEEELEEQKVEVVAPPEEVVKKQVFCECWRQELNQLQKIVFDRSTTTEVEVDLSENISGSEWSVIEVPSTTKSTPTTKTGSDQPKARSPVRKKHQKREERVTRQQVEDKKSSEDAESVVAESSQCSCGVLPSGSVCKCLASTPEEEDQKEGKLSDAEKVSTEHFYKEQNAEIFEEDLKDVIYEDTFTVQKRTTFGEGTKLEDGPGAFGRLFGTRDAIKDPQAFMEKMKRISKYEHGGESSLGEDEKSAAGEAESDSGVSGESKKPVEHFMVERRVRVEKEGSCEEVAGATVQLMKKTKSDKSVEASSIVLEGEDAMSIRTFSYDSEKKGESLSISGEVASGNDSGERFSRKEHSEESFYKDYAELPGEITAEDYSAFSAEEELYTMWGESQPPQYEFFEKEEEEGKPRKIRRKKKREGIPICCLCRCLVPEGLTVCPCGETTVVEVFKKESVEIFIQNEDDVDYMVRYVEKKGSSGTNVAVSNEKISTAGGAGDFLGGEEFLAGAEYPGGREYRGSGEYVGRGDFARYGKYFGGMRGEQFGQETDADARKRKMKFLPPESFFPFQPEPENKFEEAVRPVELTKDFLDSFEKQENEIPIKCAQLLDLAKREVEVSSYAGEEDEELDYEYTEPEQICDEVGQIKTDFSDLKMFIPCGLEDWRVTVQKKYQEWFFKGPKIQDETYYDITIEDISEDEFELDEELEKFFES